LIRSITSNTFAPYCSVHHQQVGQREVRVPQDVGPDLRELRLHRGGLNDLGAEHLEELRRLGARAVAHAADDRGQRGDLLEEVVHRDPLRHVRHEQVVADREAAALREVARHPVGGARRDGGAQHHAVPRLEQRQQLVEHAANAGDVDLDVAVRRRAQRQHDVLGADDVGHRVGELEAAAREHALQEVLGAGLVERHAPVADSGEHGRLPVDADHAQPPVGERQRERQADAAQADDRDAFAHPRKPTTKGRRGAL
jgi:hypothetical protein